MEDPKIKTENIKYIKIVLLFKSDIVTNANSSLVYYCSFIVILSFVLALLTERNNLSTYQNVPPFLRYYSSTISRIFAGLVPK